MSDKTDEAERDARTKAGEKINEAYDAAESTTNADLKGQQPKQKQVDDAIDEILNELDDLKEELARNEYKKANKRVRKLKRDIKRKYNKNNAKAKTMIDALNEIRKIKMKDLWAVPPRVAMRMGPGMHRFLAMGDVPAAKDLCETARELAWSDALDKKAENTPKYEVPELPLHHIQGISEGDAEMIQQAIGVKTIGDFANNKLVKKTLYLYGLSKEC